MSKYTMMILSKNIQNYMNTTQILKHETINNTKWYIVDAKEQNLGRLSTQIVSILQGKNSKLYTPHVNPMHYIVIINAKHINLTGQKKYQKVYKRHSGRPGGLKITTFTEMYQKSPNKILENSIKGMLPKTTLGKQLFRQLKIYSENNHPHIAQQPTNITFK